MKVQIDILENGYTINGKLCLHPAKIEELKGILGEGRLFEEERKSAFDNNMFTYSVVIWDDLGLNAILNKTWDTKEQRTITCLTASLQNKDKKVVTPKQLFTGSITAQGQPMDGLKIKMHDFCGEYILGESYVIINYEANEKSEMDIFSRRKRTQAQKNLKVDIQDSGININGELFGYPLNLMAIRKCIAVEPETICEADEEFDNGVTVNLDINGKESITINPFYYDGQLTMQGKDYTKAKKKKDGSTKAVGTYGDSKVDYYLQYSDKSINFMVVTQFNSMLVEKYKEKKTDEEILVFEDMNFKLMVLDELMYVKGLLQPKFDVYEFAEQYQKSDIDTDSDTPLKPVLTYFKNYPIEKRYASEITELEQNGNEIYHSIAPQWDGEDSVFDIKSEKDAAQFPNLKKVVLFSDNFEKLAKQFEQMGIQAKRL